VCTEATKLLMATVLHHREIKSMPEESRPSSIADSFRRTASLKVWLSTATVAALYSANNLLSFFLVAQTDPGTLAIAKATVPYLCAVLLRFLGAHLPIQSTPATASE
jgi:UDP-sugar transporter A1/2/3